MITHKVLLCSLILMIVENVKAVTASNEVNCQRCDETYMKTHHFDRAYKCRGCFFTIYNELSQHIKVSSRRGNSIGHEIYCGCPIYYDGAIKFENGPLACKYAPPEGESNDERIDIEHIVPKSRFKKDNPTISNDVFNLLTNNFHNMYPGIRKINNKRQVKEYGNSKITTLQYGRCETTIGTNLIHPRDAAKGQIAKAYLYMNSIGAIQLTETELVTFNGWHNNHPPEKEECEREKIIFNIQGNHNPFISNFCH